MKVWLNDRQVTVKCGRSPQTTAWSDLSQLARPPQESLLRFYNSTRSCVVRTVGLGAIGKDTLDAQIAWQSGHRSQCFCDSQKLAMGTFRIHTHIK